MTDSTLATARALFRRNATFNMTPEERKELAHTCARVALEYCGIDEGHQALLDDTAGITCSDRDYRDTEPCPPPEGCL